MRRVLLTCLVVLAAAVPAEAIVGGRPASQPYPFMAQLWLDGEFTCGASLVRADWVLTAAHCVEDPDSGALYAPSRLQVRLGRTRLSESGGEQLAVAQIVQHEAYDGNAYDVALLRLARASAQPPVRLVGAGEESLWAPGVSARIIGWGTTTYEGNVSDQLLEADVPVRSDADCENSTAAPLGYESTTMLCAGETLGGRDTCQGDSGGPLLVRAGDGFVQAGVVSFGLGCAFPLSYGVYARTGADPLRSWLASKLPAPPPALAPPPPPAGAPPAQPTNPPPPAATPSRVRIRIGRDLGMARVAARRRSVRVRIAASEALTGVVVRLSRGGRTVARTRIRELRSRATPTLRSRRLRRGRYGISVQGRTADGRTVRAAVVARLR